jgi:hypothetical protein
MKKEFEKRELQRLETIEQSWSGDELKIETDNMRVWLTHRENIAYDGDYQIETLVNGRWILEVFYFEQ